MNEVRRMGETRRCLTLVHLALSWRFPTGRVGSRCATVLNREKTLSPTWSLLFPSSYLLFLLCGRVDEQISFQARQQSSKIDHFRCIQSRSSSLSPPNSSHHHGTIASLPNEPAHYLSKMPQRNISVLRAQELIDRCSARTST